MMGRLAAPTLDIKLEDVLRAMQQCIDAVPPGYCAGGSKAELAIAMQKLAALPTAPHIQDDKQEKPE
jgi:hypothetical protein